VYGNLARNLAVDEESTAFMAGLSVGEAKGKLGWRVWYNYRVVQRDAVFGMFSDSDFGGGGTGTFGHLAGADFSVNPNLCFGLTLFLSTIDDTDQTAYNRIQLDMNVKFGRF
jgi:hypothetical protein